MGIGGNMSASTLFPAIDAGRWGRGPGERSMKEAGDTWIIRGLEILLRNLGFISWAMEVFRREQS